ncbi:hypothetical protein AVEN_223035-1 [Araneus ventricosus]|uniref:Uncharacterized protein n=1 Tax=Araneus ventricosus TaxID=182803 RepID=A0A4Y2H870_ARAVE|nr:hypothetical protein AVEN_223035-1 [Araneus ventricosus]
MKPPKIPAYDPKSSRTCRKEREDMHWAILFRGEVLLPVCYESLLSNHVNPALQQRAYVDNTLFMQDSAPPHLANPATQHAFWK